MDEIKDKLTASQIHKSQPFQPEDLTRVFAHHAAAAAAMQRPLSPPLSQHVATVDEEGTKASEDPLKLN